MKKYLPHTGLLLLLGLLLFLYGFSVHRNMNKKIIKVDIEFKEEVNYFLTHSMVNKLLIQNFDDVKKQAKTVIDLHKLEKKVLMNPYIENASVFLTIKGELKSTIKQRTPIIRIVDGSTSYYIDKQGVKVPLSLNYSARVPLVSGVKSESDIAEIMQLMELILNDDFLKKEIVAIQKLENKEYFFTTRSGDYKIEFGKIEEASLKFRKLKAFYNKTFVDKTIKKYKTINVKYHNQVVCTK
ncbi:cell division protein FtsQ [Lutibacter sp. Hel_I_33_5]|uniref:cell division protein FtsQ/DivIB n=1 Tax=Lutibacter sp. Hel_I_33_5 TaxID=1566289 RepID=UPI0011A75349|nr:cell division protein FtsQ/DivIB [Lutibacter sp. Hel_I_33_5]TVZ56865.1 cell division protein FtsQ [Lutibacter sp. Hel_I_33_5]